MSKKTTSDQQSGQQTKASPKSKSHKPALSAETTSSSSGPRALEKVSAGMTRLLGEQEFETIEEANAYLQQYVGTKDFPPPARRLTMLERAQDVMYKAWEARSRKQRIKLAREALALCADCADAYVLLAEETTRTSEAALKLYEEGMRAGERALGEKVFAEDAGQFWGILATRPYMRARAGVAECLWEMGESEHAIAHFRELLRLNPNDNQGNRHLLAQLLLQEERNDELCELLDAYKDEASAEWTFTRALWKFRSEGASQSSRHSLQEAFASNVFVPLFMLEINPLPLEVPEYISRGEESEGVHYVLRYGAYWLETPGAIEWFAEVFTEALDEVEKKVKREENERKLRLIMGH